MTVVGLDFDGVVADSYDVFYDALAKAFAYEGHKLTHGAFRDIFATGMWTGIARRGITGACRARFEKRFRDELAEHYGRCRLAEGMGEALVRMQSECDVTIVTSNYRSVVQSLLAKHEIELPPERILGKDEGEDKVEKIRSIVSPDRRCFYIGDTRGDLIDGRAAGAVTVAVTWGWHGGKHLRDACHIVRSPQALLELLGLKGCEVQ